MYITDEGKIIQDSEAYNSESKKYPRNWNKDTIPELSKVIEVPKPDDTPTTVVTGFIIDETKTQVWEVRNRTQEELDNLKLIARQEALEAVWRDPFDLLDDILERGIDAVKTDRNAIKTAHPKP